MKSTTKSGRNGIWALAGKIENVKQHRFSIQHNTHNTTEKYFRLLLNQQMTFLQAIQVQNGDNQITTKTKFMSFYCRC